MGVRDFDVAQHQPHPPGYPVFIALGKISTGLLGLVGVPSPASRARVRESALAGALVPLLFRFVHGLTPVLARSWTTIVVVTCPLFWFTALRPLSDMTGLACAVAAQALMAPVLIGRSTRVALVSGALLAGFAIGIRSQTFLLTLPLLAAALVVPRAGINARVRMAALAAAALGVLVWAIPLVAASGGVGAYMTALESQAGEDFSGVVILWTMRKARVAADALMYTFLWPWGHLVVGSIATAVAFLGAVRLLWRAPRVLVVLAIAYVPYAVFHLLFHEVNTVRTRCRSSSCGYLTSRRSTGGIGGGGRRRRARGDARADAARDARLRTGRQPDVARSRASRRRSRPRARARRPGSACTPSHAGSPSGNASGWPDGC